MKVKFTFNLQEEEIQHLADSTETLLFDHVQWLKNIHQIIICDLPDDNQLIQNDQQCSFGRWYFAEKIRP